jgi:hypothetical protein
VSLHLKLDALINMIGRLQPVQKIESGVTANVISLLIDRMKAEASPLPRHYSQIQADAYFAQGQIAFDEGTEESARRAVAHFENQLEVNESIGCAVGIAWAKFSIAKAKSKYDVGDNNEELKASQEWYELCVSEYGEEEKVTITSGKNYAINLQKANRGGEARELLTKLLTMSMQILGPHHNTTKEVTSALRLVIKVANQD